ncbi:hypothetical protein ACSBR1_035196 [Camellia fascicularis]
MPLTRYQVRNEFSLADQELYRAADKDDPEALLEGVAMAGLVGVLRQLGDLAEFAAEIFHDLHEQVMATAARGHGLMVRVQQLEAEFPSIEKAFLSQTSHSLFFYNTGVDWHPNQRMGQNLITQEDLPRFVMDSYEECRGPPRLFLLDKFDVAGAGACLKRYTDPSFFKVDSSSSRMMNAEVQREKKTRKAKKKGSRWRNGETPEVLPTSHAKTKLHQLFLEESVENHVVNPANRVKLKRKLNGFPFDSKTGKSYMEKFLKTPTPDHNVFSESFGNSSPLRLPSNIPGESGIEILEISTMNPENESPQREHSPCSSPDADQTGRNLSMDELSEVVNYGIAEVPQLNPNSEADSDLSTLHQEVDEKEIMVDGERTIEGSADGYQSDDIASEVENYMDALASMDSEMETDAESRAKNVRRFLNIKNHGMHSDASEEQQDFQALFSDSQSIGNSTATDDGNVSSGKEIFRFSYSDSLSNLAENSPSDGDVSVIALSSTEICEADIVNMSSDRCSVNGESPSTQLPEHTICDGVCIDNVEMLSYRPELEEPTSNSCLADSAPTSVGLELDATSFDCNERNAGDIIPEENTTHMGDNVPCISNFSDVPSQTRDDFLPELSAENHPVYEFNDEDPQILSDASLHLSNTLVPSLAKQSSENLLDDVLREECTEDECTKISVDIQIDSPHSVASCTEQQPLDSALPELETCAPDVKHDDIVSEVDGSPLFGEIAISSTSAVDNSPQAGDFAKQQFPEIIENGPPLEPDSEVGFSYSRERNIYRDLNGAYGEEFCGFSSDNGMVGRDDADLKSPSDFQNSPDHPSDPEVHVHLDDVVTETIHSEPMIVATTIADNHYDDNEDDGKSLSTSCAKLQEESVSILQDLHRNGLEIDESCSPQHRLQEAGTEKDVDQQAVVSSDLDSVMPNTVSYDDSKSELLNNVPNSTMVAISGNTVPFSSNQNDQDSESKSPQQINVIQNMEVPELRTPLEQEVELQADQFDVESPHAGKESLELFFHVAQIQSPNHMDQEGHTDASFDFFVAHPSQSSISESLPQLNVSEQATDPSGSILPSFGLLPEACKTDLDGMPPLPPLPPMQWRIGKVQHASLAPERDLVPHNLDPSPQILPSAADEKAQLGHLPIEGEITQPSNLLLPLSPVKDENSEHGHSTPLSLQMPTMVNGNSDNDFRTSGRTQSTNPFLALPTIFNERSQLGFLDSEGGTKQPTLNPITQVINVEDTGSTNPHRSLQENPIQPLHQSAPQTSSEDKKLNVTSVISEGKVVNRPDTTSPPPVMQDDWPQHIFSTSEGQIATFEDGKVNGNRQKKLPWPRNPLIDAVAALDKSKLRKVTQRVRPQMGQVEDERDSLLEQIRTKSFNLRPAAATRPCIQGPKTNLKVAAILEKANSIRQALAGSDEDDDADGWSDS